MAVKIAETVGISAGTVTTEFALDLDELRPAIQEEYREVALHPEQGFHFHTGRALATLVGYRDEWVRGIPESAIGSFAGAGNPFSVGELRLSEKVADVGSRVDMDSLIFLATKANSDDEWFSALAAMADVIELSCDMQSTPRVSAISEGAQTVFDLKAQGR